MKGIFENIDFYFFIGNTNQDCGGAGHNIFKSNPFSITDYSESDSETKILTIPGDALPFATGHETFYVCLKINNDTFEHQGTDYGLRITLAESLLPLWLAVIIMIILFCLSGLFSGMYNIGDIRADMFLPTLQNVTFWQPIIWAIFLPVSRNLLPVSITTLFYIY